MPHSATRTITEVVTQPILNSTGQLRWALNNIVNTVSHANTALALKVLGLEALFTATCVNQCYEAHALQHLQAKHLVERVRVGECGDYAGLCAVRIVFSYVK